jgi:hypothetical protein
MDTYLTPAVSQPRDGTVLCYMCNSQRKYSMPKRAFAVLYVKTLPQFKHGKMLFSERKACYCFLVNPPMLSIKRKPIVDKKKPTYNHVMWSVINQGKKIFGETLALFSHGDRDWGCFNIEKIVVFTVEKTVEDTLRIFPDKRNLGWHRNH